MTVGASGDTVVLVAAGVSSERKWRGGPGVVLITAPSGTPAMEIQAPDGVWVPVKDTNGVAVAAAATPNMFNVDLPSAPIRMAAGGGAMNVVIVGV